MSILRETISNVSRSLVERPDALMLEIGAGGELLIARLRIIANLLLLLLPPINHLTGGSRFETMAGFAGVGAALALSLVWLHLSRRARYYRWLPFVTGAFDVTLISAVLILLASDSPPAGLNSQVVFACYLLAIVITALKNDGRASLFIGILAVVQYGSLAAAFVLLADPQTLDMSAQYGSVNVSGQIQRTAILLIATLITAVIVFRMQRLVMLSGTDSLTGLPNRSYLVHRVPPMLADARRDGLTITFALIDLDHFKRINDRLGHLAGDRALQHVVRCLREAVSRSEPLIRIGGEEFVLLLHLPLGTAWERLERLRLKLANAPFQPGDGELPMQLTFSAGLAACPHDADDLSGLLRKADLRLREAKRLGRNRLIARD